MDESPKGLRQRWKDERFRLAMEPFVRAVFVDRQAEGPLDLRGLDIEVDLPAPLEFPALIDARLKAVDFSHAKLPTRFVGGTLEAVSFHGANLREAYFAKSRFVECDFSATLVAARIDDCVFERCTFDRAVFRGPVDVLNGGIRNKFLACSFDEVVIRHNIVRATTFTDSTFRNAHFLRCDMRGAKFFGCRFTTSVAEKCGISGIKFEGGDHELELRECVPTYDVDVPSFMRKGLDGE